MLMSLSVFPVFTTSVSAIDSQVFASHDLLTTVARLRFQCHFGFSDDQAMGFSADQVLSFYADQVTNFSTEQVPCFSVDQVPGCLKALWVVSTL